MRERRRVADDQLYCHFITFSVYRRRRLLELDPPKRILLGVLNFVLEKHVAKCVGFVVMPDHVHVLVWLPKTGELSKFMHEWKRQSSLKIRAWYRDEETNYFSKFGEGDKFWQPKYYSFSIDNQSKLEEKLQYMHNNLVRAGLVDRATDWPWSSARWYASQYSVGVKIEWVD